MQGEIGGKLTGFSRYFLGRGATKNSNNNWNFCFGPVLLLSSTVGLDADGNGFWSSLEKQDQTTENAKPKGQNPICGGRH